MTRQSTRDEQRINLHASVQERLYILGLRRDGTPNKDVPPNKDRISVSFRRRLYPSQIIHLASRKRPIEYFGLPLKTRALCTIY